MTIASRKLSPTRPFLLLFPGGFPSPEPSSLRSLPRLSTSYVVVLALPPLSFPSLLLSLDSLTSRMPPYWTSAAGEDWLQDEPFMSLWWLWITSTMASSMFPFSFWGGDQTSFTRLSTEDWGRFWQRVIVLDSSLYLLDDLDLNSLQDWSSFSTLLAHMELSTLIPTLEKLETMLYHFAQLVEFQMTIGSGFRSSSPLSSLTGLWLRIASSFQVADSGLWPTSWMMSFGYPFRNRASFVMVDLFIGKDPISQKKTTRRT